MDLVSDLLFPVPTASYKEDSFPGELLCVPRSLNPQTSSAEDFVPLLLLRCLSARFLLIFLHSNFDDIGRCRPFCKAMRDEFGVHVMAVEYPGYGICPGGRCDERGATESAETAFRFACEVLRWPVERILVCGRSVGTGPAVALAVQHKVGGLILVSPFLSVREVVRDTLGPVANLIAERFPNKDRMPFVQAPCLVVHGQKDTTVPTRHGEALYGICKTRKRLVTPADLDHNANLLRRRAHFVGPMLGFFALPQVGKGDEPELQVPSWALDRRLVPHMQRPLPVLPGPCSTAGLLPLHAPSPHAALAYHGASKPRCVGCATCGASCSNDGYAGWGQPLLASRRSTGDFVQDTISDAVEHILAGGPDESWADSVSWGETTLGAGNREVRVASHHSACRVITPREAPGILVCDDEIGPARPHPTVRPRLARMNMAHAAHHSSLPMPAAASLPMPCMQQTNTSIVRI